MSIKICGKNELYIVNFFFQKSNKRRRTRYHSKIGLGDVLDFYFVTRKSNATFLDFRTSREAVPNSDHFVVASILRLEDDDVTKRLEYRKNSCKSGRL